MTGKEAKLRAACSKTIRSTLFSTASILAFIGATAASAQTTATDAKDKPELETIVVTTQKRAEDLQKVPVAVSTLTSETLTQLDVTTFADYVRDIPGLVAAGNGPGQSAYYIRGMATNLVDIGLSEIGGTSPNVALYLDEQPVSTVGHNLDVYMTDMARVEVLPGPQGTLYGAGSQAGTIRLITNPPVINETSGDISAELSTTEHGALSNSVEGYINIPIIADKLAIRLTAYDARQGGYIDNVPAELTLSPTNAGIQLLPGLSALKNPGVIFESVSNSPLVQKDFNDATYDGFRLGALYDINDDWNVRAQFMHQLLHTDGAFYDDPASPGDGIITNQPKGAGEYAISSFYPEDLSDEFSQASLTVNGRIGALQLVYAGAYLNRQVHQRYDYSGYIEDGLFVAYYVCDYSAPRGRTPVCYNPTYGANITDNFTRQTHELRGSTDIGDRLHVLAGVFYDDSRTGSQVCFVQPGIETLVQTTPPYYAPNGQVPVLKPPAGASTNNPNGCVANTTFFNDVIRTEKQLAGFGEATFKLIPDELTVTGGVRYHDMQVGLGGSTEYIFGGINLNQALAGKSPATETGATWKGNITWTPTDPLLFYFTYSQGFRPGGFNRNGGSGSGSQTIPYFYQSDMVYNYELGWKTQVFDNRLRFNGDVYQMDWTDMQLSITDPTISPLVFVNNVGAARVRGLESDIAFAATDHLTLFASVAATDAVLVSKPDTITNLAPVGSSLAFTPKFQFTARARYDTTLWGDINGHAQLAVQHSGMRFNSLQLADRVPLPAWTSLDLNAGINNDAWSLDLFVKNLTDERIVNSILTSDPRDPESVGRPRTIGVRLTYNFDK